MLLYASTIFLSAFLLFQIQPMIAKMILPWFGGSAAVWITAMLFFQTALLGGYLYAHWAVKKLSSRMQTAVHGALLLASLLFLPVAPSLSWRPEGSEEPVLRILGLLSVSIGLPYFLLSSTSPLIQAWYSRKKREALPYRLFALSNLASLLGLLAYPFAVEPLTTLRQQSMGWSLGYAAFAVLAGAAAAASGRGAGTEPVAPVSEAAGGQGEAPTMRDRLWWLALSACASTLLLAVTNHLTQNVASIPFLWVLPLGLYLLTFILTFDFEGLYNRRVFAWLVSAALAAMCFGLTQWNSKTRLLIVIPVYAAALFIVCLFCHGELVKRKPSARYLTSFYVMLSVGGALGGVLVGVVAPRILKGYFELPAAMAAAAVLLLLVLQYRAWRWTLAVGWAAAVIVFFAAWQYVTAYAESARVMSRNFYGVLRVTEDDVATEDESRTMVHGTVIHGRQFMAPDRRREQISYYGPDSGVALAFREFSCRPMRTGVIGLGAGSLAAFAKPGDLVRFFEINPLVERLARSEFTYLDDCRGRAEVALGDGRLSLEREQGEAYDLLVVDAFSGDAIPAHLLTTEALEVYFRRLRPGGILALHITNTHLDLEPVVAGLAAAGRKDAVIIRNDEDEDREIYSATWALLSSKPLSPSLVQAGSRPRSRAGLRTWTDDYNNLFQIMK